MSSAEDAAAERALARAAKKEAERAARAAKTAAKAPAGSAPADASAGGGGAGKSTNPRQATGVLESDPRSRDVKIGTFSLNLHGRLLVEDTTIELNYGQRYGLLGRNGCGKSSFLKCLAEREVPIPEHLDVYLLEEEAKPEEVSALQYVINSAQAEHARLEALAEKLLVSEGPDSESLMEVYDRQAELDPATMETRACTILVGLGFDAVPKPSGSSVHKQTKDMSGGWRMRVALARALFMSPSILLLDEPTNHLDLDACVWLEDYLSTYPKLLVVVSHSQDFLNGVCTSMMVMQAKKMRYWAGNFDGYCQTRADQDKNQWTLYRKQQEEIAHIKEFIASCGTYANLVRQAKSREKQLNKMIEDGLIEKPFEDILFRFKFPECGTLPPPLISFSDVSFSYSGRKQDYLFHKVSFGVDCDSRVALVGPNGAGKSTLLKLMVGENQPTEGSVSIKGGITIGRYHQHSAEVLDEEASPVEYISRKFTERLGEKKLEDWRSVVGTYGIPSDYHMLPIKCLSDGLKTRLVFCEISLLNPHILLLDEPTNAADMELIDSMAEAIQAFQGGLVVISHDFRLLAKVAKEIWLIDHGIKIWPEDIRSYKSYLRKANQKKKAQAESSVSGGGGGGGK